LSDTFVDFKEIKQRVSMEAVLGHYNVTLRRVNQHSLRGHCPLPSHSSDRSKESFIVQTEKNIWTCQSSSCVAGRNGKKGGNVLDFVAIMAHSSIRDAALQLRQLFLLSPNPAGARIEKVIAKEEPQMLRNATDVVDDGVNKPLTFQLKGIDCTHVY